MSQSNASLYERLGRHEGIARITRELMKNHLSNPIIKTRYLVSEDLERVERRAVEFFCAGIGGPESYSGKDLLTTHKGEHQRARTVFSDRRLRCPSLDWVSGSIQFCS